MKCFFKMRLGFVSIQPCTAAGFSRISEWKIVVHSSSCSSVFNPSKNCFNTGLSTVKLVWRVNIGWCQNRCKQRHIWWTKAACQAQQQTKITLKVFHAAKSCWSWRSTTNLSDPLSWNWQKVCPIIKALPAPFTHNQMDRRDKFRGIVKGSNSPYQDVTVICTAKGLYSCCRITSVLC